ncbi:hypothetical protein ABZZ74_43200 [Streptomyces sp. NPDC006476]|uniref:hypothetical protein n=1 Tax=Streptomyces sp. NPDC006476 TaxID=3157175 RepID=UPI0033B272EA
MTGELIRCRLTPQHVDVLGWISGLPAPAAVVYEAGPTGFGLARALSAAGIRCEVLAPSRLQRPAGERVKTDARDALHLANCCAWTSSPRCGCPRRGSARVSARGALPRVSTAP